MNKNTVARGTMRKISREEFCAATHTKLDCWLFEDEGNPIFWKDSLDNGEVHYIYDNGHGLIRCFKDMKEYHEIWMCQRDAGEKRYSLYSTWTQY